MYGIEDVQAAVVTVLKDTSAIAAIVGQNVREIDFQGMDYSYPAVRVSVSLAPSDCRGERLALVTVSCHSEHLSSLESSTLATAVMNNLVETTLPMNGAGRLFLKQPVQTKHSEGTWKSEVVLKMLLRG